jgi:hypothetical protein
MTVQVRQHIRLDYDPPQFQAVVYIGDSVQGTLNLYNKGKNTLYNVTAVLDIPGIAPESAAFLGNMESGASKSADIYASVGVSPDDPAAYVTPGPAEGRYLVTYEDEYGDGYELEIPVGTEIMEMELYDPGMIGEDMEEPEAAGFGMPWWGWAAIAAAAAVTTGVVSARRKAKRERKLLEDMDDDELS